MNQLFIPHEECHLKDGMTISKNIKFSIKTPITFFSLGKDTSISQECYDSDTLYLIAEGKGAFVLDIDKERKEVEAGSLIYVQRKTLCGMDSQEGMIYLELIFREGEYRMNQNVKANEVFELKNLISYEEGSIANMDIVSVSNMKYVLMAFDEGTGLTSHRAPGNAIVFALEGKAIIGYEGKDYELKEGECFHFEKGGLHSVTAQGKFKMALLLVIE